MVLGMHRSGTSALAGILNLLGCDAPNNLMPLSEANEKGFFESSTLYGFHKELLESAGSSWTDWQSFHEGWFVSPRAEEYEQRAVEILHEEFGKSRLFVLKDPRICRLVPFWVRTLEDANIRPLILHTHRNPVDVVSSITRHHNISRDLGMLLWLRHVLDAERNTRSLPRHFTSYTRLMSGWGAELKRSEAALGVIFPRQSNRVQAEVGNFLEGSLQHFDTTADHISNDPNFPEWVRTTFDILERWAETGEDSADHIKLDRIGKEFDQAVPAFAQLVSNSENTRKKLSVVEEAHSQTQGQLTALKDKLEGEKIFGRKAALDLEAAEATLATLRDEQALLQSKLLQREEESSQVARTQDQAAQDVERLKNGHAKTLKDRFGEIAALTRVIQKTEIDIEAERQKRKKLEVANMALLSSTSWRLTAPLRRIVGAVRKRF